MVRATTRRDRRGRGGRSQHGVLPGPGTGAYYGLAQAIDAGKLLHIELDAHPDGHHGPGFGPSRVSDAFFVVKLLQDSDYDGPIHFAVDPNHDSSDIWEFAVGCMRTYRTLASKAKRFVDDPEIRDAVAECGGLELSEPSVGPFSPESGRAVSIECFDGTALTPRRYRSQRLDQLVVDLVFGLRSRCAELSRCPRRTSSSTST